MEYNTICSEARSAAGRVGFEAETIDKYSLFGMKWCFVMGTIRTVSLMK